MKKVLCHTLVIAMALGFYCQAHAKQSETLSQLDQVIELLQNYEYGDDSELLVDTEKSILALASQDPLRCEVEKKLLKGLNTNSTVASKDAICRMLKTVGTEAAIPDLENILADSEVSHLARYALASQNSKAASAALLRALPKAKGDAQAGIINSLADRCYAESEEAIDALLTSKDRVVVEAAVRALGRLGGTKAVRALRDIQPKASKELTQEIDHALLCCAEIAANKKQFSEAVDIYAEYYQPHQPQQLCFAGLRGLVKTHQEDSAKLLTQAIQAEDVELSRFAIGLVGEGLAEHASVEFAMLLDDLPQQRQLLLLKALGNRRDQTAAASLIQAARNNSPALRLAAIEALGHAGDESAVAILVEIVAARISSNEEKKIARASLQLLDSNVVEKQLIYIARSASNTVERLVAIDVLASKKIVGALVDLTTLTHSEDEIVRNAAIAALGTLGGLPEVSALLEFALQDSASSTSSAAEVAMGRILLRAKDPETAAELAIRQCTERTDNAKVILLRLLRTLGTDNGLDVVRRELKNSAPHIRNQAFLVLTQWPNTAASEDLLGYIDEKQSEGIRQKSLKGYLRLAKHTRNAAPMYSKVLDKLQDNAAKKSVLTSIGLAGNTLAELNLLLPYLDEASLQATAGLAALRVAHRLRHKEQATAREVLHHVIKVVDHDDVRNRAQEVLSDMDKYEDHILEWVGTGPYMEIGKEGAKIYAMAFAPENPKEKPIDWSLVSSVNGSWKIDLELVFGSYDHCAAYLRTRIWSEHEQEAQLEMGSDDGIKAWVNGDLVYDHWRTGDASPRQFRTKIYLHQGWNDLMVKVVDHQGGWTFGCRARQTDGQALEGVKFQIPEKTQVGFAPSSKASR